MIVISVYAFIKFFHPILKFNPDGLDQKIREGNTHTMEYIDDVKSAKLNHINNTCEYLITFLLLLLTKQQRARQ